MQDHTAIEVDSEAWLTEVEAAKQLGLSVRTMQGFRVNGRGPPFSRFGRCVRYKKRLNEEWALAQLRRSTSEVLEVRNGASK